MRVEDRVHMTFWIPCVQIRGTDVEVSADDFILAGVTRGSEMLIQCIEPGKLTGIVIVFEILSVGAIDSRESQVLELNGDQSRTEVVLTRKSHRVSMCGISMASQIDWMWVLVVPAVGRLS